MQNKIVPSTAKQERSSNFELLRIFSMLMIVASHAAQHMANGGWTVMNAAPGANTLSLIFLGTYGQLGVILFIIISSWFLCDKQGIHIQKAVNLYLQAMLCSVAIFFFIKIFNFEPLGAKQFIKTLLTPIYGGYWFIRSYLFFYLLVPFLQKYLQTSPEEQIKKLLIVLTVLIPVLRFFFWVEEFGTAGDFVYVFIAVYYLKKHPANFIEKHARALTLVLLICMWASLFLVHFVCSKFNLEKMQFSLMQHIFANRHIFLMILAMSLFYIFKNYVKIGHSKLINAVAGTTLGVYIFHENPLLHSYGENGLRQTALLFEGWLKLGEHFNNGRFFPLYFLGCVVLVFAVCSLLDFLRKGICRLIKKVILK